MRKRYFVEELRNGNWMYKGEYNKPMEIANAIDYSPGKLGNFIEDVPYGNFKRLMGTNYRIAKRDLIN